MKCKICNDFVEEIIDFGPMPIANGFLNQEQFDSEKFYPLRLGVCVRCKMVQLIHPVPPDKLFHDNYAYISTSSLAMQRHFELVAKSIKSKMPPGGSIIEIGCNDGVFLQHFKQHPHLGFEPSSNVARTAQNNDLNVVDDFFCKAIADGLEPADIIFAANTVCHIPDMYDFLSGIEQVLAPNGRFIFEDPYWWNVVQNTAFDQIYDEHVYYFSITSVVNMLAMHNLKLTSVFPLSTHGGSMQYTIVKSENPKEVSAQIERIMEVEKDAEEFLVYFKDNIAKNVEKLNAIIDAFLIQSGETRIVGYGATSKSTTLLNYAGLGRSRIEYITDTTPGKIGKFSPGMHIPIVSPEPFKKNRPDLAILLAWNYENEIFKKEKKFREKGGKFITYVPEVLVK